MTMFTMQQWAILALVLVLGWLLGLLSRTGGAKWRREYDRERAAHLETRRAEEAHLAAANARTAELERQVPAVGTGTVAGTPGLDAADRDHRITDTRP